MSNLPTYYIHDAQSDTLMKAIYSGDLELCKKIKFKLNLDNLDADFRMIFPVKKAFQLACQCGHLNVAKWLRDNDSRLWIILNKKTTNIDKIDTHHLAFLLACKYDKIHIVNWLLNLPEFSLDIFDTYANIESITPFDSMHPITMATMHGNLDILIRLFDIMSSVSQVIINKAFDIACEKSYILIIKVIMTIYNLHKNDDILSGFMIACKHGNIEVVETLLSFMTSKTLQEARMVTLDQKVLELLC